MTKTISYNQTEHQIQNYCVTFTHQIDSKHSRIKNSFVIKGANVNKEQALEIAKILFAPPIFTNIEIVSVENDENTLTPAEYEFIRGKIKDLYQNSMRSQEINMRTNDITGPVVETEYDKYLNGIVNKMTARMNQFPVYHT